MKDLRSAWVLTVGTVVAGILSGFLAGRQTAPPTQMFVEYPGGSSEEISPEDAAQRLESCTTQLTETRAEITSLRERQLATDTSSPQAHTTVLATYETESYRLVIDGVRRAGTAIVLGLYIESTVPTGIHFRGSGVHLLDENGELWPLQRTDSAGFFPQRAQGGPVLLIPASGVEIPSGTRRRSEAVFTASGQSNARTWSLVIEEVMPLKGRQVLVHGIRSG